MEALAVFGGVAAAITLAAEMLKLSRTLRRMAISVRFARRDIKKISNEMDIAAEAFQAFHELCSADSAPQSGISFDVAPLISWTNAACQGLRILLRKVKGLTSEPRDKPSRRKKLAAHVRWYLYKRSVSYLGMCLSVARESMNGFMNIRKIEKLNEQIELLQRLERDGKRSKVEAKLGVVIEEHMDLLRRQLWVRSSE